MSIGVQCGPPIWSAPLRVGAIRKAGPSDAELDGMHDAVTDEGINRGIFGAPRYVLRTGEIFWGQDRLEFLDCALAR